MRRWTSVIGPFLLCSAYGLFAIFFSKANLADDSWQYFQYGKNLLDTGVYGEFLGKPDCRREPGYGAFLAVCIFLFRKLSATPPPEGAFLAFVVFCQSFLSALAAIGLSATIKPGWVRRVFLAVFLLSPTVVGMNSLIFSETLFVTALMGGTALLLFWARTRQPPLLLAGAIVWSVTVLTKDYFTLLNLLLLGAALTGMAWAWARKSFADRTLYLGLSAAFAVAALAQQAWQWRNEARLGDNAFPDRKAIALAGKVGRVNGFDLARDWKPALAASLGTNFCISAYGPQRCLPFHMLGADEVGLGTWSTYLDKFEKNKQKAWKALTKDMWVLYWQRPGMQWIGSFLEALRIAFIESVPPAASGKAWLDAVPRLWRLVGSLLVLVFVATGIRSMARGWSREPIEMRLLYSLALCHLVFHFAIMSQVTNLARYGFPLLPWMYLFTAKGLQALRQSLRTRRKDPPSPVYLADSSA